jgi:predicted dehydrogenase
MKKKIGVIGCGNWGLKVIKILKKISSVEFVCDSKSNLKKLSLNKIDWIFVLTPDNTHYNLVKYFLNKKCNVFCEKPLTRNYAKSLKLFELSKKNNKKLYVDDIENFKKKKIKIHSKINSIFRAKKDSGSSRSLIYRLAYHDIYLLYNFLKNEQKILITKQFKKKELQFTILGKKNYNFKYSINYPKKCHLINKVNFLNFYNNPLQDMLKAVLNNKVDFKKNKKITLFANQMIEKIMQSNNNGIN